MLATVVSGHIVKWLFRITMIHVLFTGLKRLVWRNLMVSYWVDSWVMLNDIWEPSEVLVGVGCWGFKAGFSLSEVASGNFHSVVKGSHGS